VRNAHAAAEAVPGVVAAAASGARAALAQLDRGEVGAYEHEYGQGD
jgi:hypothetical protein